MGAARNLIPLGAAAIVVPGQSPEGKHYNHAGKGFPFYQGKKEFRDRNIGPPTTWTTKVTREAEAGDILMSVRAPVGPINFATDNICIGRGLAAIRCRRDIDKDFLFYQLLHKQPEIAGTEGAVFASISKAQIEALKIWNPDLLEQRRIVGILDESLEAIATAKVNAERNAQSSQAILAAKLQQILQESANWNQRKLGEICNIARGGSPRPIRSFLTKAADGVNWIKIGDASASSKYIFDTAEKISPGGIRRSRMVHSGDFLLSNSMSFGRPYIMRTSGCIHDGWLVLSGYESNYDQDFLYLLLGSQYVYRQFDQLAAGSTVRNLNIDLASRVVIPAPPLHVQKQIAGELDALSREADRLTSLYQRKASALDELKQSLLRHAFSGAL